ncbi:hypothetical protein ATK36_4266 [Amycolatopsis sulphurea]|uniref:Uncharacterized protein n=1 Tax=Amycolatopsis sulphurea TaxID=76022 RepID=A0A2A9FED1_9PSEU|nr:hypothetical protein [Amycolatopsis sulphurea]PFG49136.1 hypothetical protein ATK36_4266 [Amycolatopsis sulphurea]
MPHEERRPQVSEVQRRRRLDEVFGDVLPETTSDERGRDRDTPDSWYLENRPPHHDW